MRNVIVFRKSLWTWLQKSVLKSWKKHYLRTYWVYYQQVSNMSLEFFEFRIGISKRMNSHFWIKSGDYLIINLTTVGKTVYFIRCEKFGDFIMRYKNTTEKHLWWYGCLCGLSNLHIFESTFSTQQCIQILEHLRWQLSSFHHLKKKKTFADIAFLHLLYCLLSPFGGHHSGLLVSFVTPIKCTSSFITPRNLLFGLPLLLLPGSSTSSILWPMYSLSLLFMCPNSIQFNETLFA